MKKTEIETRIAYIEKELKKLQKILDKDSQEYAEELSKEYGIEWDWQSTYPYKIGVASATVSNILTILGEIK